ncbi:MAG: hypothetical protein ACREKA_05175 [Candidatus Methylomirabilales bacterium]
MREWSVRFEISLPDLVFSEEHADDVVGALKRHKPAVSYGPHTMSASFCLGANSPLRVAESGFRLFRSALEKAGIKAPQYRISGVEIQNLDELDRSLKESNLGDLMGVAELARILRVSKQRASELARIPDFPKPIANLASGPVWKKTAIARHIGSWVRRPGRPKRTAGVPA